MGRHSDDARRRGVAGWPIVVLVAILVAGGLVTGYLLLTREDPQAKNPTCTTTALIEIAAGTGSAPGLNAVTRAFNETAPVARSVCLTAEVSMVRTADAADLLVKNWQGAQTPRPTIWAPDNLGDVEGVAAKNGSVIAGLNNDAIATSPVVLAVRRGDTGSFTASGNETMAWTDLPGSTLTMVDGQPLSFALPDPRTNRATSYALQSMIAPISSGAPTPISASTAKDAGSVVKSLAALVSGSTAVASTQEALAALADGTASFTAVPVVESELAVFNRSTATPLAAVYPSGPTAGDYITSIGVTGPWVDADGREAATALSSFLSQPAAITALSGSDLRIPGVSTQSSAPGIDFRRTVTVLPAAGAAVVSEFTGALGLPDQADPGTSSVPSNSSTTTEPQTTGSPVEPSTTGSATNPPNTNPPNTDPPNTTPTTGSGTGSSTSTTGSSTTGTSTKPSTSKPSTSKPSEPPAPATPTGVYTLVVDSSGSMADDDGGQTRAALVQEALRQRVSAGTGTAIGLWTVSTAAAAQGYAETVGTGLLTAKVGTVPRTQALAAGIDALNPAGDRYSYAAIIAAYEQASKSQVKGVPNRVIAVVSGGDNTPSLPRTDVVAALSAAAAANPGVTLDIIGIGAAAPTSALTEVAAAGGGTYTEVASASEVAGVLTPLMTP
ncbi:VWA domain-containing protein [Nakamurella silvestris]|nr:VWA domain-containing protein [Nakamurella silvestris]